ncbi:MAG: Membrane protein [Devosia sp.]|nr:Membrane protein [Devosia sp.]
MYNTEYPSKADLPSTNRLIRSTVIAGIGALAILVTVVLPSEYGIDPTGLGRLTGLTTMGQIKMQLAREAAADGALSAAVAAGTAVPSAAPGQLAVDTQQLAARVDALEGVIRQLRSAPPATPAAPVLPALVPVEPLPTQQAAASTVAVEAPAPIATPLWRDEVSFTLTPMQGAEYKLVMQAGAVASYEFVVDGGVINFDAHGEGEGQSLSYEKGRGVASDAGEMIPPVSGTHGWFFRNRGNEDVVVTLRTGGDYQELRKLI